MTQHVDASRTEMSNLFKGAREQLEAAGFDKRRLGAISEHIDDLDDDEEFWRLQANSLAILATPDGIKTFRLANRLQPTVQVADRFHLTPLLRAITFANHAFVLALSENAVRLVEVHADVAPEAVKVPGLPKDAASAVGKSTLNDRGPRGRIHGSEGHNVLLRQYARKVDAALRPTLAGRDVPLILAANERLASIFRSVNSYPGLLEAYIGTATDRSSDAELAAEARQVLDAANARTVTEIKGQYQKNAASSRATAELSTTARAATMGAIETLLVDINADLPGLVDEETGEVTLAKEASAKSYDVVDEIAGRAMASGARVLGVRKADLPVDAPLAAILRFAV